MVGTDVKIIREARKLADKYDLLPDTLNLPIVQFHRQDKLTDSRSFEAVVGRRGKVHWYNAQGAALERSIGWILRELAQN